MRSTVAASSTPRGRDTPWRWCVRRSTARVDSLRSDRRGIPMCCRCRGRCAARRRNACPVGGVRWSNAPMCDAAMSWWCSPPADVTPTPWRSRRRRWHGACRSSPSPRRWPRPRRRTAAARAGRTRHRRARHERPGRRRRAPRSGTAYLGGLHDRRGVRVVGVAGGTGQPRRGAWSRTTRVGPAPTFPVGTNVTSNSWRVTAIVSPNCRLTRVSGAGFRWVERHAPHREPVAGSRSGFQFRHGVHARHLQDPAGG